MFFYANPAVPAGLLSTAPAGAGLWLPTGHRDCCKTATALKVFSVTENCIMRWVLAISQKSNVAGAGLADCYLLAL
jgi:hypothetical protein